MRSTFTFAVRMTAVIGLAAALASPAAAGFVPVSPPPGSEASHIEILEGIYSPGTPWVELGTRTDPTGGAVDFTNGTLEALRIDDFGVGGPLNVISSSAGDADDQLWTGGPISATAEARYAEYTQEFGYDLVGDGLSYVKLFDLLGYGLGVTGDGVVEFAADDVWAWCRAGTGSTWSSDNNANSDTRDHLVTYELAGLQDNLKHWLLFWEDLPCLGDADYNDLVVEITAVPEPCSAILLAGGLGLGVLRRWRGV